MHILTSTVGLALLALVGIIGGSIIAVPEFELPLPRSEPVVYIEPAVAKCPVPEGQSVYQTNCFAQAVMELTNFQ